MDILLFKGTALFYLLAMGAFFLYLVLLKDVYSRIAPVMLLIGFALHTAALAGQIAQNGFPAVTDLREALSVYSWLIAGIYLLVQLKYRLTVLGCFVAPLAFLMALAGLTFGSSVGPPPPRLQTSS